MMWGPDHRFLFPAALLTGGFFLVLADTLARTGVRAPSVAGRSGDFLDRGSRFSVSAVSGREMTTLVANDLDLRAGKAGAG